MSTPNDGRTPAGPRINPDSLVRKFLMWWFRAPHGIAYVSVNGQIDMTNALAYLEKLGQQDVPDEERVTVQHLLAAVVSRALHHHPAANARIIGRRIIAQDHVGVAMPVNLLGHKGGRDSELSVGLVEACEGKSLRQIATETRGVVKTERSGQSANPFIGLMKGLAKRMPQAALDRFLDGFHAGMQTRTFADQVYAQFPATTALTNPGAALGQLDGARFTGGAFSLPQRLIHVGTLWGVTPIVDDVMAIRGEVKVVPTLPVLMIFDHRLVDGVAAGRLLTFAVEILQDPERWFGPSGRHPGPNPHA